LIDVADFSVSAAVVSGCGVDERADLRNSPSAKSRENLGSLHVPIGSL
jgi:hypothetical protein